MKGKVVDFNSALISRCAKGDRKAQEEVYRLYYKAMFNTCVRILKDTAEAEDTMQEAFLSAFGKLSGFSGEVSFGAWLKRIVVNKALDVLRSRKVCFEALEEDTAESTNTDVDIQNDTDKKDMVKNIRKAILSLPEGYRVVLSLVLLEGYDHEEIAEILNITASTSRSQFSRARKKLVEILQKPDNLP